MSSAPAAPAAPSTCEPSEDGATGQLDQLASGQLAVATTVSESPRWFYGWTMLAAATLVMVASSPGQTFGFSFFNPEFRATLSISSTTLSATYLVATLLAAAPLTYVGALTDRFGLRRSLLAAVAAMSLACVFAAQVQNLGMLFCMFVTMRLIGPGALVLLANNTLANWFDRRLGLASGAMQLGMAVAVALVPVGAVSLIATVGWRNAYLLMAAFFAAVLLPFLWLMYREHPEVVGQLPDGERAPDGGVATAESPRPFATRRHWSLDEASQTRAFWILMSATGAWALIGTGLVFHMEGLFVQRGLSTATAAWAPMFLATGMASMQLFGGLLADRIAVRYLVIAAMAGVSASCAVAALAPGSMLMAAFAVYGCAQGLMTVLAGTAWARFFGRLHLGKIRGTALTAAVASSSAGPLAMGVSVDYLGGFEPSLWFFSALAATLAVAGFWTRPPGE